MNRPRLLVVGCWVGAIVLTAHLTVISVAAAVVLDAGSIQGMQRIGATRLDADVVYLDRSAKTDILVPANATSGSNALMAGSALVLREAIEKSGFHWQAEGATLPEAMMNVFLKTGVSVNDPGTGRQFKRLDLLAAVDYIDSISPIRHRSRRH